MTALPNVIADEQWSRESNGLGIIASTVQMPFPAGIPSFESRALRPEQ
jgi:hypothetical protein